LTISIVSIICSLSAISQLMRLFSDRLTSTAPAGTETSKTCDEGSDETLQPFEQPPDPTSRCTEKTYKHLVEVLGLHQTVEILDSEYRTLQGVTAKIEGDQSSVNG